MMKSHPDSLFQQPSLHLQQINNQYPISWNPFSRQESISNKRAAKNIQDPDIPQDCFPRSPQTFQSLG
jgi:hypothetical protein